MRMVALLTVAVVVFTQLAVMAGDIKLPQPKKSGGEPVLNAIDKRGSAGQQNFPTKKIEQADLATILWAATGKNRDGSKWTVPMGMGRPPYTKIYLVDDTGGYLYKWDTNTLEQVLSKDVRAELAMQDFAQKAPQMLIFVADSEQLAAINNRPWAEEFAVMVTGAMSQNIYLAAEAVGAAGRVIYSVHRDKIAHHLELDADDKVICAMPMGKK
ncbi:MAG: nitroreductase family protein [Planctomycetes bacterium]|nr:nitroreductase family protein [Planctomycetota bacterium]